MEIIVHYVVRRNVQLACEAIELYFFGGEDPLPVVSFVWSGLEKPMVHFPLEDFVDPF